ncbi:MAG: hypothetical protein K6D59_00570 [Bacteroidales bacterium]|nr:hypothetical protein [Bacteroidales bacterium]
MKKNLFLLFVVITALTVSCYHYADLDDTVEIGIEDPVVTASYNSAEILIKPYVKSLLNTSGLPKDLIVEVYYSRSDLDSGASTYIATATRNSNNKFVATLTYLSDSTRYYYKVKAYTPLHDAYFESEQYEFTTLSVKPPVLGPTTVSNVTAHTATFSSSIVDTGDMDLLFYGFCWSKNAEPTQDNCDGYSSSYGTDDFVYEAFYLLDPATTYYVRSFATTLKGTYHGEVTSFTTLAE